MKKRGRYFTGLKSQVAIFLVMAVIILLAGLLYFFYQKQASEKEIEVVQPELVPIKSYVGECIKGIAQDGLEKIGLSGGYINVPQKINNDPRAYLSAFSASGFKLPYWWHDGIDSIPPEDFINQQLRGHIKNELKSCLNNFEPFSSTFEINELKGPVVDVQFNEDDVSVVLKYPLEIIGKNSNFRALIENFEYNAPIRFRKVYEIAKLIMERENRDYFLEKRTIDLYSMDTDIPTTDIEVRCKAKTWQLSDIKEKLRTLLRVNLPYIRIIGTDYNPNLYVPNPDGKGIYSQTYFQQHYLWEIDKNPKPTKINDFRGDEREHARSRMQLTENPRDFPVYKNMKVTFTYDNWPLQINARPSENGILKSNAEQGADLLKFFCLHIWHFTYDVDYPVLATIFDQENENKQYQFNFAFKVNVEHNQPNRISKGKTLFEFAEDVSSEAYCSDVQNQITVFTVNNASGEDVKDINLTFVCGRFYCDMGQSDWLSFGAAAGITKRFPYCVNGVIKGAKQGFADSQSFMQTDVDGRSYILFMNPVKEFQNYKVVKHLLSNPGMAEDLGPNEKASIFIKSNQTGFETFAYYPKETEFPLKLPAGKDATYEVTVYLADEENLIGGYIGNWKISKDDLKNANEVRFHAVEQEAASEDERALFVAGLSSYSKNIPAPELKNILIKNP